MKNDINIRPVCEGVCLCVCEFCIRDSGPLMDHLPPPL